MNKNNKQEKDLAVIKEQALAQIQQELAKTTDIKELVTKLYVQNRLNELRLNEIETSVRKPKETLTLQEAADFLGFTKSYLYKLVFEKKVPHYKPLGKIIYFERSELEALIHQNRVATQDEINSGATTYIMNNPLNG